MKTRPKAGSFGALRMTVLKDRDGWRKGWRPWLANPDKPGPILANPHENALVYGVEAPPHPPVRSLASMPSTEDRRDRSNGGEGALQHGPPPRCVCGVPAKAPAQDPLDDRRGIAQFVAHAGSVGLR